MPSSHACEPPSARGERLNRFLARAGIGSRRRADELIAQGRVAINGSVVTRMATFVVAGRDTVTVDDVVFEPAPDEPIWILMNKAVGILTARRDQRGRVTIFDGLPPLYANLIPVGRLDLDTEGVILLTNQGQVAARLMHPRNQVERVYEAEVAGTPSRALLRRMRHGIDLGDRTPARAEASIIGRHPRGALLRLVLREGRKREVKRLCREIGHRVLRLRRVSFAGLTARRIEPGGWRKLTASEIRRLENVIAHGE